MREYFQIRGSRINIVSRHSLRQERIISTQSNLDFIHRPGTRSFLSGLGYGFTKEFRRAKMVSLDKFNISFLQNHWNCVLKNHTQLSQALIWSRILPQNDEGLMNKLSSKHFERIMISQETHHKRRDLETDQILVKIDNWDMAVSRTWYFTTRFLP